MTTGRRAIGLNGYALRLGKELDEDITVPG
jgi:hypothetical protein